MATIREMLDAEQTMRDLLDREGLPPPDAVEYRAASIVLLWNDTKTAVIIDIDGYAEG